MHPFSFCPNPTCPHHQVAPEGSWYVALGFYYTKCFGDVPRYRCKTCGRTFSSQTFSLDYFAKKRLDYRQLERLVSSSMSQRALSRHFKVSLGTINNRIQRLSHQSLATHALLRPQAAPREPVCIDGFVSFDRSQYFPNNITISLTAHSQFILSLTHATLRRSGRCTDTQKHRKNLLYRSVTFEKAALQRSFSELLDQLYSERCTALTSPSLLITDEKPDYAWALTRHISRFSLHHLTVNSKAPRTLHNPLFASNYIDRELRKDLADHRRETVCFPRNVANMLNRLVVYLGWHNYEKPFRIGQSIESTHAEHAGIKKMAIYKARLTQFKQRAFLTRTHLFPHERKLWLRGFSTPLKKKAEYVPAYVYA